MTQYVLRAYHFGYNDENFYVCGASINDVYTDRAEAEAEYRRLQLEYLRSIDLGEHEKFFNGEEAYIRKMATFIEDRTGHSIIAEQGWVDMGTDAHAEMSDDDLFEFGEAGELHAYKLIEYEDEPTFYALWDPRRGEYFKEFDEGYEGLLYGASEEELMRMLDERQGSIAWFEWEGQGTLDELTDNPELLRKLIESNYSIEYNEDAGILSFEDVNAREANALNELMKTPIFEVRELSLDAVVEIEKGVAIEYGGETGSYLAGCAWGLARLALIVLVPIMAIAGLRCLFGSCNSFLGAVGDTFAWLVKWAFISIAVLVGLALVLGVAISKRRRKRKSS